jgi:hypothetical protein
MKQTLLRTGLGLLLVILHGLASAEVPTATAEALMHKSGVWAQLADVAPQAKAGIAQSAAGSRLDADDLRRLESLADDTFSPTRLRASFQQVLASRLTAAQASDGLKWFASPAGKQITRLEEASSADADDMNQALSDGNLALATASARRQTLLAQLVRVTRAAEGMVSMQINTTVGILQGLASAQPDQPTPSAQQLRAMFEAERPQMLATSTGIMLTLFAHTYQPASDRALEQYVRFLSSRSGTALSAAMMDAMDEALSTAAQRLGRGISEPPDTSL